MLVPPPLPDPAPINRLAGFAALRNKNYRLFIGGTTIGNIGDWMDQVAVNWLVLVMTDSPVYLGLVNFVRYVPMLVLPLLGGVVADRLNRQRLMNVTLVVQMGLAFLLAYLVTAQLATIAWIIAISTARGIANSFTKPAQQALIGELVPRSQLQSAIGLKSASNNATRVIGPAIAGLIIGFGSLEAALWANALSFLPLIGALWALRLEHPFKSTSTESVWKSFVDGVQYMVRDPLVSRLTLFGALTMFLGHPYVVILPVMARDVLQVGPEGYGLLSAAPGFGAIFGALWVATHRSGGQSLNHMILASVAYGLLLVAVAISIWFMLSLVLMTLVGVAATTNRSTNHVVLQLASPEHLRGRVTSTIFVTRGLDPLGGAVAGFGAAIVGAPLTLGIMGGLLLAFSLAARVWFSSDPEATTTLKLRAEG